MKKQPDSIVFTKPSFRKTAIAFSLTFPAVANTAGYVCNVEGITVHAPHPLNSTCRVVDTNNTVESSAAVESNVFTESGTVSGKTVAIPGGTPALRIVQTTGFRAIAADHINIPHATPAVQTPVITVRNEDGTPAPISISMAQACLTSQIDKNVADGPTIFGDITPSTIKPEIDTTDVLNVMPDTTQPQTVADRTPNNILDSITIPITQTHPTAPAIQALQTIIQNPVILLKTSDRTTAKQNNQTVTVSDETLDKTPIKVETKCKDKVQTPTQRNAKNTKTVKTAATNTANEQTTKTAVTPAVELNTPNKPAAAVSPVDQSKTSVQTLFPKAYKLAADIPFDPSSVYNDIKILPHIPITSVINTAEAANPRLNITLHNRQNKSRSSSYSKCKAPVIRTAPVAMPAPKPSPEETRKQTLRIEVRNEQVAITRFQIQLNAVEQKGDQIRIQQLTRTINARKASIRAIQGEMPR